MASTIGEFKFPTETHRDQAAAKLNNEFGYQYGWYKEYNDQIKLYDDIKDLNKALKIIEDCGGKRK